MHGHWPTSRCPVWDIRPLHTCSTQTLSTVGRVGTGWEDLELDEAGDGRFTTSICDAVALAVAPQGGIVAAIAVRAMERVLGHPEQTLRTLTAMFAGVVQGGPVEVDVQVLRRGPVDVAAHRHRAQRRRRGRPDRDRRVRRVPPRVRLHRARDAGRRRSRGAAAATATRSPRASTSSSTATRSRSGSRSSSAGRRSGGRRGSRSWTVPPRRATGTGSTTRRSRPTASLDVAGPIVLCDTMPGSVGQKLGPDAGQLVRTERRLHAPRLPSAPRPAGSSPTSAPATPATATPASTAPSGTREATTAPPSSPTPPR